MTIEQTIAKENARVFKTMLEDAKKEIIACVRAEFAKRDADKKAAEESAARLKLITLKEAKLRLGVSMAKLNAIIAAGDIMTATPPDGNRKVLENSLNEYIDSLTMKGVA